MSWGNEGAGRLEASRSVRHVLRERGVEGLVALRHLLLREMRTRRSSG